MSQPNIPEDDDPLPEYDCAHSVRGNHYNFAAGPEARAAVSRIAQSLGEARPLAELVSGLTKTFGRPVPEEEVLAWLALGAAARRDGRALLRPVVHTFVRGVLAARGFRDH